MRHLKHSSVLALTYLGLSAAPAFAQTSSGGRTDVSILPFTGPNMSDVVVDSQMTITRSNNDTSTLDLQVYCFGTNLRSIPNPVSPKANITAQIEYQNKDGNYKTVEVTFKAAAAFIGASPAEDLTTKTKVKDSSGVYTSETCRAQVSGNRVRVDIKNTKTIGVNVLSTGVDFGKLDAVNARSILFRAIRFEQKFDPANPPTPGPFMGTEGPLTAAISWSFAENGKKATVYAGFPGENKYCGGFFSPLVLSFNEDVPVVDKSSFFPLWAKDQKEAAHSKMKISWPSFEKEMYWLAIDRDGNGKIDYGNELFGDINGYKNGYENLKAYDDNGDGVIDEKDKIFSKLVLWRDKNHNGISEKSEIIPLKRKGVTSISVGFKNELRDSGKSARILGPGEFTYKVKGAEKKGIVWDIYVTAVP